MLKAFGLTTSSFKELIREDCVYVDKTRFLYSLIKSAKRAFLARPRRFGKSLLVSTLESILKGEKELFQGLWISTSDYHWKQHAVIKLNFSSLKHEDVSQLDRSLSFALKEYADIYGIILPEEIYKSYDTSSILSNLCKALHAKYGQVALLEHVFMHEQCVLKEAWNEL